MLKMGGVITHHTGLRVHRSSESAHHNPYGGMQLKDWVEKVDF
jgi:hypothetical protein